MYTEQINEYWKRESTFESQYAKPGTAYFCHLLHRNQLAGTVYAELVSEGEWEASVENEEGEEVHRMGYTYPTYREAIDDMIGWYTGQ